METGRSYEKCDKCFAPEWRPGGGRQGGQTRRDEDWEQRHQNENRDDDLHDPRPDLHPYNTTYRSMYIQTGLLLVHHDH